MIFSITTLTKNGNERHFTAQVNILEVGLEAINNIVATGETLVRAQLLEGKTVLALPIEAFDGRPLQAPIEALEQEYKQVLRQSIPFPVKRSDKIVSLVHRQRDRHEAYIIRLQAAIVRLQVQVSRINGAQQSRRISQLTANLERYQRLLATAIDRRASIDREQRLLAW